MQKSGTGSIGCIALCAGYNAETPRQWGVSYISNKTSICRKFMSLIQVSGKMMT